MKKRTAGLLALAGAVTVAAVALGRDSSAGRKVQQGAHLAGRRARYLAGRLRGVGYRLSGGVPDPAVPDDVLADRIRSALGPLEKRFDLPRIHVMVEDHVALLHGEVPSVSDRAAIEWAVVQTPGVRGIESYLHVGLLPGDTRPSEGRARAAATPSPALHDLLAAAGGAGVPTAHQPAAVRAVLGAFTARIPEGEREQLLGHLPADVRALADVPHFEGAALARMRTVDELVHVVTSSTIPASHARAVTGAVLAELRRLVPEETADVAAVLPAELQRLWADPRSHDRSEAS